MSTGVAVQVLMSTGSAAGIHEKVSVSIPLYFPWIELCMYAYSATDKQIGLLHPTISFSI
jgi:hypothetical protein